MAVTRVERGPRPRTDDHRRAGDALSVCALLRAGHGPRRPFTGDRLLSLFVLCRAQRYDSGKLEVSLCTTLESGRDVGVLGEPATLELGRSQEATRIHPRTRTAFPMCLSGPGAGDQPPPEAPE